MKFKPLFVLIADGGDGSYNPVYILDADLIETLEKAYEDDILNYENGIGIDGDGFHYSTINVPADATEESLGISVYTREDFADLLEELHDEDSI